MYNNLNLRFFLFIGTLINVTFDNLGGNSSLGYFGCNSSYYCRICELTRNECGVTTEDVPTKYRSKDEYAIALDIIETSYSVEPKDTKGIARYCVLNDLRFFHILDNFNVDIMHDICEGVIPFLLLKFFKYCIHNKIIANDHVLNNYLFNHDYGLLNSKNIPSYVSLTRSNLGQNASQNKCIIQNLPYIFYDFRNEPKLEKIWSCVFDILKILRIIYSINICENDLKDLEKTISSYLKQILQCFDIKSLTYKHHMMIHYANVIRAVGPLVHMSTMRFEMNHKIFTNFVRRSNNFMNVSKSLANSKQTATLFETPYQNVISHGKLRYKLENSRIELHEFFEKIDDIQVTKWLKINSNTYRNGLYLKGNDMLFYEIIDIFCQNGVFFFGCEECVHGSFDPFLFSIEIRKMSLPKYIIISENEMKVKKTFEKKIVSGKCLIFADCLNVPVEFNTE